MLAPYGEQFNRLRRIYQPILGLKGAAKFLSYSNEETLFLLEALAERPDETHFECDRLGFNIMMHAIYGVRYGVDGNRMVQERFQLWETMFCCKYIDSIWSPSEMILTCNT